MSLHHMGGTRYRVTVYVGKDQRTGKLRQRTKSFHATGIQEARRMAAKVEVALRAEIKEGKVARQSVAGYVAEWIKQSAQSKSPTTMMGYTRIANAIVARFGRMNLVDLKARDVRSWYAELGEGGMTPATIAHYHAVLRAICRQAWIDGDVPRPATLGVKLPKAERATMTLPTDQALVAVIAKAKGDLKVALWLALATGMRRGEVVALRWSDLVRGELIVTRALIETKERDKRVVRVKSTKGKRGRAVALDRATVRALARHRGRQVATAASLGARLDKHADRYVFADLAADQTGQTPYPPMWLTNGWTRVCRRAGVTGVRLHDIRHRHATTLLEAVPIHVVSARLGHSKVSTTVDIYAHADRQRDRDAARVIGQAMKALGS